jgi:hypothetical protein
LIKQKKKRILESGVLDILDDDLKNKNEIQNDNKSLKKKIESARKDDV